MVRHPLIKALALFFAVIFLTVQGFAQAHITANGGADHSHDGVACDVTLVTAEATVLTPPADVPQPVLRATPVEDISPVTEPACTAYEGRAPPPRGPPAL